MELALTVFACFCFMIFGALIGNVASARLIGSIVAPLLEELRYVFKHVASHDLQVYHGINESDWMATRPHDIRGGMSSEAPMDMAAEAERLAREFERMNGDLPPTAE